MLKNIPTMLSIYSYAAKLQANALAGSGVAKWSASRSLGIITEKQLNRVIDNIGALPEERRARAHSAVDRYQIAFSNAHTGLHSTGGKGNAAPCYPNAPVPANGSERTELARLIGSTEYKKSQAAEFYAALICSLVSGDNQGQINASTATIEHYPEYAPPYLARAEARYRTGDHGGADADCTRFLALDPEHDFIPYVYIVRGNARYYLGDKEGQIADYRKAMEMYPNANEIARKMIEVCLLIGNWLPIVLDSMSEAQISLEYREVIRNSDLITVFNPRDAEAYYRRGIAKNALGDKLGAEEDFRTATETGPEKARACHVSARACADHEFNSKRYKQAIVYFDRTIAFDPQDAGAFYLRGLAKGVNEDYAGALADLDKAIELNPERPSAYFNRGVAKKALGDKQGAEEDFRKADELKRHISP